MGVNKPPNWLQPSEKNQNECDSSQDFYSFAACSELLTMIFDVFVIKI